MIPLIFIFIAAEMRPDEICNPSTRLEGNPRIIGLKTELYRPSNLSEKDIRRRMGLNPPKEVVVPGGNHEIF